VCVCVFVCVCCCVSECTCVLACMHARVPLLVPPLRMQLLLVAAVANISAVAIISAVANISVCLLSTNIITNYHTCTHTHAHTHTHKPSSSIHLPAASFPHEEVPVSESLLDAMHAAVHSSHPSQVNSTNPNRFSMVGVRTESSDAYN